jgi:hypothetical protein
VLEPGVVESGRLVAVGGAPQPGGGVESVDWRWSSGRDMATCSQLLLGAQ